MYGDQDSETVSEFGWHCPGQFFVVAKTCDDKQKEKSPVPVLAWTPKHQTGCMAILLRIAPCHLVVVKNIRIQKSLFDYELLSMEWVQQLSPSLPSSYLWTVNRRHIEWVRLCWHVTLAHTSQDQLQFKVQIQTQNSVLSLRRFSVEQMNEIVEL